MHQDLLAKLEQRLGRVHAKQRLGIETDHEAQAFGNCPPEITLHNLRRC
jgi:hypothetical protein